MRPGRQKSLGLSLPPPAPIPVSAMMEAKTWTPIGISWPIDERVFNYRPDSDAPPRPRIPVAAIIVHEARTPEPIARPVPCRDIDPPDRLEI